MGACSIAPDKTFIESEDTIDCSIKIVRAALSKPGAGIFLSDGIVKMLLLGKTEIRYKLACMGDRRSRTSSDHFNNLTTLDLKEFQNLEHPEQIAAMDYRKSPSLKYLTRFEITSKPCIVHLQEIFNSMNVLSIEGFKAPNLLYFVRDLVSIVVLLIICSCCFIKFKCSVSSEVWSRFPLIQSLVLPRQLVDLKNKKSFMTKNTMSCAIFVAFLIGDSAAYSCSSSSQCSCSAGYCCADDIVSMFGACRSIENYNFYSSYSCYTTYTGSCSATLATYDSCVTALCPSCPADSSSTGASCLCNPGYSGNAGYSAICNACSQGTYSSNTGRILLN